MSMHPFTIRSFIAGFVFAALACMSRGAVAADVEQWDTYEVTLTGPKTGNPFVDVQLSATFENGSALTKVNGFYDGDGTYRVRFMPMSKGNWHYTTHSNAPDLDGKTGNLTCIAPTADNHGPVRVHDTFHFAYADGSPFFEFGTTCYAWTEEPEDIQQQTLATLKTSPFNKLRMCVFPTHFEPKKNIPALWPYEGTAPTKWDFTRFNPAYFQQFENRIADLRAIGVQADVILFHPYDKGKMGFDRMPKDANDRYVQYVVARFGAYRNVWWSIANEFDLVKTKTDPEWDHLFQLTTDNDPYHHLASIHHSGRLYKYWEPWVTHASIQNGEAVEDFGRALLYRDAFQKPVVFDEVRYEGTSPQRWGRLSGEEMTEYFWQGTIAGCYVGHGEVLGEKGKPSWGSSGYILRGQSPARIAFLKSIVATAPNEEIDPIDKWWDVHTAGKAGEYYLIYFGKETPTKWTFDLPSRGIHAGQQFHLDILDTWNMTITPVDQKFTIVTAPPERRRTDGDSDATTRPSSTAISPRYRVHAVGNPTIDLPGKPYIALRLTTLTPAPTGPIKEDDPNAP